MNPTVAIEPKMTHDLPPLISRVYGEAPPPLRVSLLECLIRPVGPLALVALAAGGFGRLMPSTRWRMPSVSIDDALAISADQVLELAAYIAQKCPEVFQQVGSLIADNPVAVATLAGSLVVLTINNWRGQGDRAQAGEHVGGVAAAVARLDPS